MNSNPNRISSNTLAPPNRGEGTQLLGVGDKLLARIFEGVGALIVVLGGLIVSRGGSHSEAKEEAKQAAKH